MVDQKLNVNSVIRFPIEGGKNDYAVGLIEGLIIYTDGTMNMRIKPFSGPILVSPESCRVVEIEKGDRDSKTIEIEYYDYDDIERILEERDESAGPKP